MTATRLWRLLHLWAGLLSAVPLLALAVSGLILLWEGALLEARLPQSGMTHGVPATLGQDLSVIAESANDWTAIKLPSEEAGVYRIYFAGGDKGIFLPGADRLHERFDPLTRPESFLFELHVRLLAGEPGDLAVKITGLVVIGLLLSGLWIWWSGGRRFLLSESRPGSLTRRPLLRAHTTAGLLAAAPLAFVLVTGTMMSFATPVSTAFSAVLGGYTPDLGPAPAPDYAGPIDWQGAAVTIDSAFDGDAPSLVMPVREGVLTVRTALAGEWHNNGRSLIRIDPRDGALIQTVNAHEFGSGLRAWNAVYPLHASKVGGIALTTLSAASALALIYILALALWGWAFRPKGRRLR